MILNINKVHNMHARDITRDNAATKRKPLSHVSFQSSVLSNEIVKKFNGTDKIVKIIDNAMGVAQDNPTSGYFSNLLNKANKNIDDIPKYKITEGIIESIKEILLDIPNAISYKVTKHNIFKNRAIEKTQNKAMRQAREILEVFEKCDAEKSDFNTKIATEIANFAKNYETKDERTLKKIATSLVSAQFSANDFYNISMLQKDDDKEAKKAAKKRKSQELTRMAITASLTYLSLGALDKITRKSLVLNGLTIAGSALAAEILSRLLNKTPLYPLTPKKAAEISSKKTNLKTKQNINTSTTQSSTNTLYQNVFSGNKTGNAYDILIKNIATQKNITQTPKPKTKPKKSKATKILLAAFVAANAAFWYGQNKPNKEYRKLHKHLSDTYKNIINKRITIDLDALANDVDKISKSKNSKTIETIIDEYKRLITAYPEKTITYNKKRTILTGFIDGILKIPKTLYTILIIPSKALHGDFKRKPIDTDETFANAKNKALTILYEIIEKHKNPNGTLEDAKVDKIIDEIIKNTRNVQANTQETGDIANISRTIVTFITTYFFINDYRNKVLIESEGKDIEGANEEARERFAHKAANFTINGTLMNLGNSIFKTPLNSSLIWATIIPFCTEILNESAIRKIICQPLRRMKSREDIIDYETSRLERKGLSGTWARVFKKLTGKKSLTEKAGINKTNNNS